MPPQRASLTGRDVSTMQSAAARDERCRYARKSSVERSIHWTSSTTSNTGAPLPSDTINCSSTSNSASCSRAPGHLAAFASQGSPSRRKRDTGRRTIAFERREHRVDRRVRDVGRTVGVELPMRADEPQDRKQRMILLPGWHPQCANAWPVPARSRTARVRGATCRFPRRRRRAAAAHRALRDDAVQASPATRSSAPSSRVRPIIGARMPPSSESNGVSARRSPSSSCTGCGRGPPAPAATRSAGSRHAVRARAAHRR